MRQKAATNTYTHTECDTVAHLQGQHLSVCLTVVSSAQITALHFKALSLSLSCRVSVFLSVCPPSILHLLWVTDLKWQIRLVISLCHVTPSLTDRQAAVTCRETLCYCQKLCAPLQGLIAPPQGGVGGVGGGVGRHCTNVQCMHD